MDQHHLSKQRAELRRQALRHRRQLARTLAPHAGEELRRQGLKLFDRLRDALPHPAVVAGYVPVHGEIDVMPLLHALHGRGLELALPVVREPHAPLRFRRYHPGMALEKGAFDIPAPPAHAPECIPHVLLVPLIAFDDAGQRLGYGGGYYDRTLSALRAREGHAPPLAIGCAYAAQRLARIPALPTDAALDWIITERSIIRPGPPSAAHGASRSD